LAHIGLLFRTLSGLSGAKLLTVRVRPKEFQIMRILVTICGLAVLSLAQAQNEVVSAGYDIPTYPAFAPGQVITLFVRGLKVPDALAQARPFRRRLPESL